MKKNRRSEAEAARVKFMKAFDCIWEKELELLLAKAAVCDAFLRWNEELTEFDNWLRKRALWSDVGVAVEALRELEKKS